jgi:hypothetical protein
MVHTEILYTIFTLRQIADYHEYRARSMYEKNEQFVKKLELVEKLKKRQFANL